MKVYKSFYGFYGRRIPKSCRRLPLTYASKWNNLSLSSSSCRCLLWALFLAASLAVGAMWFRRERRHRDWAVMIETESLLLRWWRRRPCSETDKGRPSSREMCLALADASCYVMNWIWEQFDLSFVSLGDKSSALKANSWDNIRSEPIGMLDPRGAVRPFGGAVSATRERPRQGEMYLSLMITLC